MVHPLLCSLAVLDPRVGHTMDAFSPFIPVLCDFDWLFHGESCPRLDVVHPGCAWSSSPACTWHCSLHYLFLQATKSLVSSWCDHSMLASLLANQKVRLAISSKSPPTSVKWWIFWFLSSAISVQWLVTIFKIKNFNHFNKSVKYI